MLKNQPVIVEEEILSKNNSTVIDNHNGNSDSKGSASKKDDNKVKIINPGGQVGNKNGASYISKTYSNVFRKKSSGDTETPEKNEKNDSNKIQQSTIHYTTKKLVFVFTY